MVSFLAFLSSRTGIILMALVLGWAAINHFINEGVDNAIKAANIARHEIVQKYSTVDEINNEEQRKELDAAYKAGQQSMKGKLKDVPTKVTKVADDQCTVTTGFVQSYQAAFDLPTISFPAGGNVDSPSGVPISDVAKATVINGAAALDNKREASAWRDWYKRNKASHDKYCAESKSCGPATTANTK